MYTQKVLVLIETYIAKHFNMFYIIAIKKLVFYFPHVHILGTHHCFKEQCWAFKSRGSYKYLKCRRVYAEVLIAIFSEQIKSE